MALQDRKDLYDGRNDERTRSRLQQMQEIGMVEIGIADFGIRDKMSGLYIERVWRDSDEVFDDYLGWVKTFIN